MRAHRISDAPANGHALRFLVIIMLVWIAGRMIANGVFSGALPPSPLSLLSRPLQHMVAQENADAAATIIQSATQYANRADAPKDATYGAGPNALTGQFGARGGPVYRGNITAMPLPAHILAGHQMLLWNRHGNGFAPRAIWPKNTDTGLAGQHFAPGAAGIISQPLHAGGHSRRSTPQTAPFDRWAVDSWAFFRAGDGTPFGQRTIGGQAQYGASQAGAIARYYPWRNAAAPSLFVRTSRALSGPPQSEIALGTLLQPAQTIPVKLAVEQRFALDSNGRNRPAAYLVSATKPRRLPGNVRANIYAQAGVVGLNDSAYFFDLQLTLDRPIINDDARELSVGAGLWSGGQGPLNKRGANALSDVNRVDIGPRVAARIPIAGQPTQIALDWRQRVAGNAAPNSGPALTLSTRF